MSVLPHLRPDAPDGAEETWENVFFGTWTGAPHTPSARANMCDFPGIMLTCPGSNSVLAGFEAVEEAGTYRDRFVPDWKVCDRSPGAPEPF